jgi:asparagine synthase (glutamine-hydrolysing)
MAHGLEVRPPLLDHKLLELAAQIPSRFKVRGREGKSIFKQSFRGRLPTSAVDRRKQGFELPIDDWIRGPLRDMIEVSVLNSNAPVAGLINPTIARRLYRSHVAGSGNHGAELWTLLVLSRWAERYLGANSSRAIGNGESTSSATTTSSLT